MVAMIVALAALTVKLGERMLNEGAGWDGMTYVMWARDFPRQLFEIGTTTYQAQRVLPAGILYYVCALLDLKLTISQMVTAFALFNTAMLVIAAVIWSHLGSAMSWRPAAVWVGFVALFGGFANARHALYYPPLTDSAAFALGMTMTWAYLTRRPSALYVCAAIAMFTWPALTPVAIVMLLMPRLRAPLAAPSGRWWWLARLATVALVALLTTSFLRNAEIYLRFPVQELGIPKFAMWVPRNYLWLTTLTLAALLAAGWWFVLDQPALWNVRAYLRTIRWWQVALVIVGTAVLFVLRRRWLDEVATQGPGPTAEQFVCLLVLEALRGPLWGLVHHVVYYGPIILVAVLHWRTVCRVIGEWGHAAVCVFVMLVAFGAASESRQWVHLMPMLVAATITATEAKWTTKRVLAFVVLALAWSKLWFVIDYHRPGLHMVFPQQRYFMHMGPWASNEMWLVHGACAVITGSVLWLLLREHRAQPDEQ